MEEMNFAFLICQHLVFSLSCHYITTPLANMFFSPSFFLLQLKVALRRSVSERVSRKATFDLGPTLLCLTIEHLNIRQVVFMTRRLELSKVH